MSAGQGDIAYKLQERERFLRTLLSNLPGIVYRCRADDAWTSEYMSDGVELLGYTAHDFLVAGTITWNDAIHPEDRELVRASVRATIAGAIPFSATAYSLTYRLLTANKGVTHVRDRYRFVWDDDGHVVALEGFITDVTDVALADERVRESEGRYRLLAENMNDLVCLHALDGTYLYLSPSSGRVLGFVPQELVGTSPERLIHPDDLEQVRDEVLAPLTQAARVLMSEHRMRRKSGEYIWFETLFQRLDAAPGVPATLLTCSRDITTRKAAEAARQVVEAERAAALAREQAAREEAVGAREASEQALSEAEVARLEAVQANRAKDEFLQMVSHEFRTPLTTIKTATRLLLDSGDTDDERRELLETVATECDRQIDMIINLLDVSRLEEGSVDLKHEQVHLSDVLAACERVERNAARMRDQTFTVRAPVELPAVRGDAKALRRAFCTIIENAIKYTPKAGKVDVDTELISPSEVAVHIRDNGRGIRPADLPHIFEKFYRGTRSPHPSTDGTPDDAEGRAETPGVGLGLYLAHRLVRALDGRIEVASAEGQGSCFTVMLPRWNDALHRIDGADEYGFEEPVTRHD